jgi:DNA-binding NarL/FixJ family response regulator
MRVVIADDGVLLREALAVALGAAGHEVVGQAGDAGELLRLVSAEAPDLAVVDVRMPPSFTTEGLEAAVQIRAAAPGVAILILSQDVQTQHVVRLLRDSPAAIGYLLKDRVGNLRSFLDSVERVRAGGFVVDPEVVAALLRRAPPRTALDDLTPRERDVLREMAEGRSNQAIAKQLGLAERSVEANVRVIMSKLGLEPDASQHRRVLAVLTFLKGP